MLAATALVVVATGQPLPVVLTLSLTVTSVGFVGIGTWRMLLPLAAADSLPTTVVVGGRTRAALDREKTLALRAIKDLEFDRAMGKVSEADFEAMSGRLRSRALRLMRDLDAGDGYRAHIETELRRRLGSEAVAPVAAAPAACATCGTTQDADARFCKRCGAPVGGRS